MTHLAPTALLLLGLLAATSVSALPGLPALPTPPIAAAQDIQTPVGGAHLAASGQAVDACANVAAPALPVAVPAVPLPLPVAMPAVPTDAGACLGADLDDASANVGAHAGDIRVAADPGQADISAGPVKTQTQTPFQALMGWFAGLF